jgi:glycyl-tRNA synthetase beta subunit
MEGGYREYILEGFRYYLETLLFVRPVRRIVVRFIKQVLMRRPYEFSSGRCSWIITVM